MNSKKYVAIALTCAFAAFNSVAAKDKEPPTATRQGGGMTMMDMMGKSNVSCMATSDSLESLSKAVQEALKSDDKAKMKAALQRTDAQIAQMKSHMSMCMDMMNMMGGKMQGEDKSPAAEKKDEAAEHEKHHPK
ncbi:MAG TPA: hypothetical protein VJ385_14445 [Fibrobacteria bacterium]|nr:hypothetical protein [Fibrobacteria bacterium]